MAGVTHGRFIIPAPTVNNQFLASLYRYNTIQSELMNISKLDRIASLVTDRGGWV